LLMNFGYLMFSIDNPFVVCSTCFMRSAPHSVFYAIY
jgi:hypothetical protein